MIIIKRLKKKKTKQNKTKQLKRFKRLTSAKAVCFHLLRCKTRSQSGTRRIIVSTYQLKSHSEECQAEIYLLIYLGEEPGLVKTSSEGSRGYSLRLKIGYHIELCACEHSRWIEMEKTSKTRERQV